MHTSRILFAAPKSGSGKTMIACGFMEVLKRRERKVTAFKCGPDYIDPMFHRQALGIPSGNLDTFFTEPAVTRFLLQQRSKGADIAVLEGVMGYYDGLGGQSELASTYEVAKVTKTPVILVVDGKGSSVTLAAVVKGMVEFRRDSGICGILLNRISAGYYERIKKVIEDACHIPVMGYLPQLPELFVPSRHLGLIAPEEMSSFRAWITKVADAMEACVDIDGLLALAAKAQELTAEKDILPSVDSPKEPLRIAVARDAAFSFYYAENLELLERMGAELLYFSPLADAALPEGIEGLLLGGGYPENYGRQLAANTSMKSSVYHACEQKIPLLAECGGFLYLGKSMEGSDGVEYPMVGVLPMQAFRTKRLQRFGYVEAVTKQSGLAGEAGTRLRGHEFHYWDCSENGSDLLAGKPFDRNPDGSYAWRNSYECMVQREHMLVGFPHFYYYSNLSLVVSFWNKMIQYRLKKK